MRVLESCSWGEIEKALGARRVGIAASPARGASIDTRTIEAGDVFFAFKGERVDGHDHLKAAYEKGAVCAVIQDETKAIEGAFALVVRDAELALFEVGRLVRSKSRAVFVAITGSAGKTTAKDFTAELLRGRGPVLATRGNLNNHLGVPLTLCRVETEHWAAVIECGMSHAGELTRLAELVRPKVAAITNVAAAHLEFFKSTDEIAAAKSEIYGSLGPGDIAVAPVDDSRLVARARTTPATVRQFGPGSESDSRAVSMSMTLDGSRFEMERRGVRTSVSIPSAGPHAILNFLLAASIAAELGVPDSEIAERAALLKTATNRGGLKRLRDDILLIDDTYNSNPRALAAAVETLSLASDRRRVACVGEMLELGTDGARLHREAGSMIGERVDLLLSVGKLANEILSGASTLPSEAKKSYATSSDLAAEVNGLVRSRDAVLVKGSRGVRMERVVEALLSAHPMVEA